MLLNSETKCSDLAIKNQYIRCSAANFPSFFNPSWNEPEDTNLKQYIYKLLLSAHLSIYISLLKKRDLQSVIAAACRGSRMVNKLLPSV